MAHLRAVFSKKCYSMNTKTEKLAYLPWVIWGLAAFYYFADYSARVSPSVMLPDLQQAFQVTAVGLGSLSAYFYYPYVVMQIPVGLLVDRYSIRWLLTAMSILTAVACFIFGAATDIQTAQLGRFLIGFSAAFAFVSTLRLAATWFPPQRLGLLAGLTQALGMAGAFAGAYPVSYGVSSIGWRSTMLVLGTVFIFTALLIYMIVRDKPNSKNTSSSSSKIKANGLLMVLKNKQTLLNATYAGLVFAPTAVIGEFWGVSLFEFGHGFNRHDAAFIIGCIFIGWIVGGPISGWISDRMRLRRPLMFMSALCGALIISIILYVPSLSFQAACLLFFLYGVTNMGVSIAYAVSTEINDKSVIGVSVAFTNMGSILIGAILQPVVGKLLDMSMGYSGARDMSLFSLSNFQSALWILPVGSLLAFFLVFFIKETHCKGKNTN